MLGVALLAAASGFSSGTHAAPQLAVGNGQSLLQQLLSPVQTALRANLRPLVPKELPGHPLRPSSASESKLAPLRLGTMNVQWLPLKTPPFATKDLALATELAQRIVASNYDVIVFNELFEDAAREIFVDELSSRYPYYADLIDSHESLGDSGLAIFSRIPLDSYGVAHDEDFRCKGTVCDQLQFREFHDACASDDCLAAKGVAVARLHNPADGRVVNLAFTHTQADYYGDQDEADAIDNKNARSKQFFLTTEFLHSLLTPAQLSSEPLFLMGDLNIDGDLSNNPNELYYNTQSLREYNEKFQDPRTRVTMGDGLPFLDPWFDLMPRQDLGLSNRFIWPQPDGHQIGARLDYMLHTPTMPYCMTHLSQATNLQGGSPNQDSALGEPGTEPASQDLSDHIGLTLDLSAPFDHCSTTTAVPISLQPAASQEWKGDVSADGSYWFRIDDPATYAISTLDPAAKVHVYSASQMSLPLTQYLDVTAPIVVGSDKVSDAPVFATPAAPVYLRVFRPDRSAGSFSLLVHRLGCSSYLDACIAVPGVASAAVFPSSTTALNSTDSVFFRFDPEQPDVPSAGVPRLRFTLDTGPASNFEMTRVDGPTRTVMNTVPRGETTFSADDPGGRSEFMVVRRTADGDHTMRTVKLTWTTTLTVLGAQLSSFFVPIDQGDEFWNEDYFMSILVDGKEVLHELSLGSHPETEPIDISQHLGTRKFLHEVSVVIHEVDNNYDGEFRCVSGPDPDPTDGIPPQRDFGDDDCIVATVRPLDPSIAFDSTYDSPHVTDDDHDGQYQLQVSRAHTSVTFS